MSMEIQGLTPADLRQKTRVGRVVSDKMDKTVVVAVERLTRHPLYHKTLMRTKRFMAHDEHEACQVGDIVRIVETRPLSRHKRWRVVEIISRSSLIDGKEITDIARGPLVDEEEVADIVAGPSTDEEEAVDVVPDSSADEEAVADSAQDSEVEVGE